MKWILILALILSSVQVRGQTSAFKPYPPLSHVVPQKTLPADSSIKVVYIDEFKESHSGKGVASFLNGKFVDSSVWSTLPRSFIDSVYVVNETIAIDHVSYLRQYYFTTKSTYTPKLVSLIDK